MVQISPALIGIASVSVPVEMISPAFSAGLSESFPSNSTRCRSAKSGLPSTNSPLRPWALKRASKSSKKTGAMLAIPLHPTLAAISTQSGHRPVAQQLLREIKSGLFQCASKLHDALS